MSHHRDTGHITRRLVPIRRLMEVAMDSDRFVKKLQRYKRSRGVYAAAQALRRQGLSLKTALLLLARAYESERQA
jgi:hypothetical protein